MKLCPVCCRKDSGVLSLFTQCFYGCDLGVDKHANVMERLNWLLELMGYMKSVATQSASERPLSHDQSHGQSHDQSHEQSHDQVRSGREPRSGYIEAIFSLLWIVSHHNLCYIYATIGELSSKFD